MDAAPWFEFPLPMGDPAADVAAIHAWHRHLIASFDVGAPPVALSLRAQAAFRDRALPSLAGDPRMVYAALLHWRAALLDWVADVWDVIGEPALDVFECRELERLLQPRLRGACMWCLTVHPPAPAGHGCPVLDAARAHWPPSPFDPPGGSR
jgi:hypothetical protein